MNLNKMDFSTNPTGLTMKRSKFKKPYNVKFTSNMGRLIPIYVDEILPGDTVSMKMSEVTRMQTPLFPIMDNMFVDTYFFFVPNRIIWEHWKEFMGENTSGIWEQETVYEIPTIKMNSADTLIEGTLPTFLKGEKGYRYCVQAGSLADHMGIPIVDANKDNGTLARGEFEVNALPFRAYYEIYNNWFRDENLQYPIEYDKGDATVTADLYGDTEEELPLYAPKYANKFHDYFTSALPEPQKGPDVLLPLGSTAPVIGNGMTLGLTDGTNFAGIASNGMSGLDTYDSSYGKEVGESVTGNRMPNEKAIGITTDPEKSGLIVDLANSTAGTINSLRQAFAVQKFYEKQARGGSRYIELVKEMFGVSSPDARQQRPEFLGGCRKAINIDQIPQTSATTPSGTMTQRVAGNADPTVYDLVYDTTPQGNVSAYSLTSQNKELFTKSFTEHGILMGVQVVRAEHTYQDGLNKIWNKRNKFDIYFPVFACIGEQPIFNKELYLSGDKTGSKDDEAFGYQEAWAEYRYKPNEVHGEFRSDYNQTLDSWHLADNYNGLPSLSAFWMEQNEKELNRCIAVSDQLADQFMNDVFFDATYTRVMPVYSIPGLIDHF